MLNSKNKLFHKLLIFSFIFFGLSLIINSVMVYAATTNRHYGNKNKIQKIRKQQREIMRKLKKIEKKGDINIIHQG
tara:strand:- start:190 stop:417 length:228 start_codon:yes stop_codon:yes gene_type:complete